MNPVAVFQKANGLVSDGKIGPKTFIKMAQVWRISYVQLVHFLAQTHHESQAFSVLVESFAYRTAERLALIFRSPFDLDKDKKVDPEEIEFAKKFLGRPVATANYVYANRMGNGNEASGDGWKHRGQGPIMLTGKEDQYAFSDWIKDPTIKQNPNLISEKYAFESAIYFFTKKGIWVMASDLKQSTTEKISIKVNGGSNGLKERIDLVSQYSKLIPV
jgi:putative chitinase